MFTEQQRLDAAAVLQVQANVLRECGDLSELEECLSEIDAALAPLR